jgi:hypothetical protein
MSRLCIQFEKKGAEQGIKAVDEQHIARLKLCAAYVK